MAGRNVLTAFAAASLMFMPGFAQAQDVPGIEICTVEKTMERRTGCLQSNVDFLMKTITKVSTDAQRRIDAANRQVDVLKASIASLEKVVEEQKKAIEDLKRAGTPPPKDTLPPAKEGAK